MNDGAVVVDDASEIRRHGRGAAPTGGKEKEGREGQGGGAAQGWDDAV